MEYWKDIPEYESCYEISNKAVIRSKDRIVRDINGNLTRKIFGKILSQCDNGKKYNVVNLYKNGIRKQYLVHRLMAHVFLSFKPTSSHSYIVDHIDNNSLNNTLENLQVVTNRENTSKDKNNAFLGVRWLKANKKWRSYITINYKSVHLGYFDSKLDASKMYKKALENVQLYKNNKQFRLLLNH